MERDQGISWLANINIKYKCLFRIMPAEIAKREKGLVKAALPRKVGNIKNIGLPP